MNERWPDSPPFLGLLHLDTMTVESVPSYEFPDVDTWSPPAMLDALRHTLQEKYTVQPSEYSILQKDGHHIILYHRLPSPHLPLGWTQGAYRVLRSRQVLDAALGAMIGAALGVTFDGLNKAEVNAVLWRGVNELSFRPFFLLNGGILNITGSAPGSLLKNIPAGGTPPSFYTGVVRGEQGGDAGVYSSVRRTLSDLSYGMSIETACNTTAADVCALAKEGGPNLCPRLAHMCMVMGAKMGNSVFPRQWCDAVSHPRRSLSLPHFVYHLQTCLRFVTDLSGS